MATVVLVHGLWSDGSCWSETIGELRALGHQPVAAQLSLESMDDDIAAVRRVLSTVDGPVLLVGWSYGGAVITNAARGQRRVRALAYVAAFAPDEGESVGGIARRQPGSWLPDHVRITDDGHTYLDRASYGEVIAPDAAPERTALAAAVQKLPHAHLVRAKSAAPAWRELPSHYLVATRDRAVPVALQRELAARMGAVITEWDTGHGPMLSRPKELAGYLDAVTQTF